MILNEKSCPYCPGKIYQGTLFCSKCGRSRLIGIQQWELTLLSMFFIVISVGVFWGIFTLANYASQRATSLQPQISLPLSTSSPVAQTLAPAATQTPTSPPTKTPLPTAELISLDPEEFIRDYFYAVTNQRNYDHTWTLMTDDFIERNTPSGYGEYVDFWNSVDRVEIDSINFDEKSKTSAKCQIRITFVINGKDYPVNAEYHLIYNSSNNTWMFD